MNKPLNFDAQKFVDLVVLFKNEFEAKYTKGKEISDVDYVILMMNNNLIEKIDFLKMTIKSVERGKYTFRTNSITNEVLNRYRARLDQLNTLRIKLCN